MKNLINHPYILLVLAPLIWAGNVIAGKLVADDIAPFSLTLLRWVLASALLIIPAWPHLQRDWLLIRTHCLLLAVLGAVGFSLFNVSLYAALHYTSAIHVSIEQAAIPALILLLNFIIFRQSVNFLQIIGLMLAFFGVLLAVAQNNWLQFWQADFNRGDGLMLWASCLYAIYSIGLRFAPKIHWMSLVFVFSVVATLTAVPFFIYEVSQQGLPNLNSKSLSLLLFIAVFPSIVAQICYVQGVRAIGANRAGFAINLLPIFGSLLAVLILGERFHVFHGIGLALVLLGITLAERSGKRAQLQQNSKESQTT